MYGLLSFVFFFQAEDGIRDHCVTGVQTCALPISKALRELAVGQPVGSGDGRRACRRGAQLNSTAGENDSMGMARSTATRVGIIPFLFRLRRSLQETDEFVARKHRPTTSLLLLLRQPSFTRLLVVALWLAF